MHRVLKWNPPGVWVIGLFCKTRFHFQMDINSELPFSKISRVFNDGAYEMSDVYSFISGALLSVCADDKNIASLEMVADEIIANIMSYAYEEGSNKWITLEICVKDETATITFMDGGRPFDPLNDAPIPDISLPSDERELGGLGIYIVRSVMDDVSYSRDGNINILTTRKKIKARSGNR